MNARHSPLIALAALLPAAVLGACSQEPAQPANTAAAAQPKESGYIARVQALPAGQREGVLFRAIQEGGGGSSCQGITQVENMPPARPGQPTWRVTCEDGNQWSVSLADDGTALVTGARS